MVDLNRGIYIITGIMASGKTTIAQLLAEQFDKSVHVHGDVFRKMIVKGRLEMTPDYSEHALEQLKLRYRLTAQTAEMYYKTGFTVVVQDNYLGDMVHWFLDQFESEPIYYITLNPSVEAVKAREKHRNKKGYITWDVETFHESLRKPKDRTLDRLIRSDP